MINNLSKINSGREVGVKTKLELVKRQIRAEKVKQIRFLRKLTVKKAVEGKIQSVFG
jgi:hypothetical protein